jgi:hypothetical protein
LDEDDGGVADAAAYDASVVVPGEAAQVEYVGQSNG